MDSFGKAANDPTGSPKAQPQQKLEMEQSWLRQNSSLGFVAGFCPWLSARLAPHSLQSWAKLACHHKT